MLIKYPKIFIIFHSTIMTVEQKKTHHQNKLNGQNEMCYWNCPEDQCWFQNHSLGYFRLRYIFLSNCLYAEKWMDFGMKPHESHFEKTYYPSKSSYHHCYYLFYLTLEFQNINYRCSWTILLHCWIFRSNSYIKTTITNTKFHPSIYKKVYLK